MRIPHASYFPPPLVSGFVSLLSQGRRGCPRIHERDETLALKSRSAGFTNFLASFVSSPPMADPVTSFYAGGGGGDQKKSEERGARQYNPYQDLKIPYQTIYNLPTSPEFLFQEESLAQRRSWGENLTYYTGCGYLAGAVGGAGKGLVEAIRASEAADTLKLRINRVLNSSGQTGRRVGNRLGVIGLMYAGLESGMVMARDTDDFVNSVVAGLGTGALYKAASGPRSAAVAGAIGGLMVGAAVGAKQMMKRYVPI